VKGVRQDCQDASDKRLTTRTVPMMIASPSSTLRVPSPPPDEPDRGDIVLPTAEQTIWEIAWRWVIGEWGNAPILSPACLI
jgi:hypothetical protein